MRKKRPSQQPRGNLKNGCPPREVVKLPGRGLTNVMALRNPRWKRLLIDHSIQRTYTHGTKTWWTRTETARAAMTRPENAERGRR